MQNTRPTVFQMIRAPFLSSILSPLAAGTLLACRATGVFDALNFAALLVMGAGLHVATNVYNDIYDTLQGTDRVNRHRNPFSGGSGVLVAHPDLRPVMVRLARLGLAAALAAAALLWFRVDAPSRPHLAWLFLLSAFFSKYYTAAPVKLAYRGWGEVSVWFAFGPMAVLMAALSQNAGFHPTVLAAMPVTGISTLSILLIGQMVDVDADRASGKMGLAARRGNRSAARLYLAVQTALCLNVAALALFSVRGGWPILLALAPYAAWFPRIGRMLAGGAGRPETLKRAAGLNVLLHLAFSACFSAGIAFSCLSR
jgi:1,4-dihydroxy-2-naphthoate octaprenyltransferase